MRFFRRFPFVVSLLILAFAVSCTPEEDDIDEDPREKYAGSWKVREDGGQTYNATVSNDPGNSSRILIGNIYNLGGSYSIPAIVAGNSLQLIAIDVSGFRISGSGNYNNSSFTLNYTANDGGEDRAVKATYTR